MAFKGAGEETRAGRRATSEEGAHLWPISALHHMAIRSLGADKNTPRPAAVAAAGGGRERGVREGMDALRSLTHSSSLLLGRTKALLPHCCFFRVSAGA